MVYLSLDLLLFSDDTSVITGAKPCYSHWSICSTRSLEMASGNVEPMLLSCIAPLVNSLTLFFFTCYQTLVTVLIHLLCCADLKIVLGRSVTSNTRLCPWFICFQRGDWTWRSICGCTTFVASSLWKRIIQNIGKDANKTCDSWWGGMTNLVFRRKYSTTYSSWLVLYTHLSFGFKGEVNLEIQGHNICIVFVISLFRLGS